MARPFIKWAGGKGQLLRVINNNLPAHFNRYIEPFVGSGAVLFDILNTRQDVEHLVINDINTDLINTYTSIRDNCAEMLAQLSILQDRYVTANEAERNHIYYEIRDAYNRREADPVTQSCYFIFLNRTCFNGLYRVNANNLYNVPHGRYANPKICDEDNLQQVSNALHNVEVRNGDYELLEDMIHPGCFVYLDPPYKPISETSTFNSYSAAKFDDNEQIRLKGFCDHINAQGAFFMLSNSDPASVNGENRFFDELYADYNIQRVLAKRNINANGNNRGAINELLITNYDNETLLLI